MSEETKQTLNDNIQGVRRRIIEACTKSGRKPDEVRLIAVSKYVDSEIVRAMCDIGISDFGENRIQVAEPKLTQLADLPICWHWIGNLQTNKIRKVVGRFQEFHSVDRIALIESFEDRLEKHPEDRPQEKVPAYLQINVSGEDSKSGFTPEEAEMGGERILQSNHLNWVGLMTMAPHHEDPEKARPVFAKLREIRDSLESKLAVEVPRLSMGMSHDFQVAVEEGATDVRIGTVLYKGIL